MKVQVSVGGAFGAVWSADGTRLYYSTGNAIDISRDGSRLLISVLQSTAYPLAAVPGWRAELRERLAASR